jgi:hypothetical protein
MSLPVCIMDPKAGQPQWTMEASGMNDHNGVLMMQRALLAGTLGLAMARKAAAILEGEPTGSPCPQGGQGAQSGQGAQGDQSAQGSQGAQGDQATSGGQGAQDGQGGQGGLGGQGVQGALGGQGVQDGAVLRAILDAANECLGYFDDRPAGERWCDTLFHLLDLAAFAAELGGRS